MKNISKSRYLLESVGPFLSAFLAILLLVTIVVIIGIIIVTSPGAPQNSNDWVMAVSLLLLVIVLAIYPISFIYKGRNNLERGRFRYYFLADPEDVKKTVETEIKKTLNIEEVSEDSYTLYRDKKNKEMKDLVIGLVIIIFIFYVGGIAINWASDFGKGIYSAYKYNISGSDLTIFPVDCSDQVDNLAACSKPTAQPRIAFKIKSTESQVIMWTPNDKTTDSPVEYTTLNNCGIIDSKNWSCKVSTYESLGVNNGKYFDTFSSAWWKEFYVTPQEWEKIKNNPLNI